MKFQPEKTECFLSFLKLSFFATIYFTEAALYMKPAKGVRSVTLSNLLPHSREGWFVRKIKQDNRPNNSMMDLRLKDGEKLFPITHLVSAKLGIEYTDDSPEHSHFLLRLPQGPRKTRKVLKKLRILV